MRIRYSVILAICIIFIYKSNGQKKLTLDQLVKEEPILVSKIISQYTPLDKSDLIKYRHVLDWNSIVSNEAIKWDEETLLQHRSRLMGHDMEANKAIKWTIPLIEFFTKQSKLNVSDIFEYRFGDIDTSIYTHYADEIYWPLLKCQLYDHPNEALYRIFAYKLDTLSAIRSPIDCNTMSFKIPTPLKEKSTLDFIYDHYRSREMDGFSYDYFYENTIHSKDKAVKILDQLMQQNIYYYNFENTIELPYVMGNLTVNKDFNYALDKNHGTYAFADNMPAHLMDSVVFDAINKFQHIYYKQDDRVLIVSSKVKKVLDKCKLPSHKIHTCKLVINDLFVGQDTMQYYYYRFENNFNDYIDFSKLCVYDKEKFGKQCIDYKMLPFKRPTSLDSLYSCRYVMRKNNLDYDFTAYTMNDSYDILYDGSYFLLSPNLVDALDKLNLYLFFEPSHDASSPVKFNGRLNPIEFENELNNAVDNQRLNEYYKSQYEFANYLKKSKKRVEDVYPDALPLEKKFNVRFPLEYREHLTGETKFKIKGNYNPRLYEENNVRSFSSFKYDTIGHYHKRIIIGEDENGSILYLLLKPKSEFELRDTLFYSNESYRNRFEILRPMRNSPLKKIQFSLSSSNDFAALTNVEANVFLDISILNLKLDASLTEGEKFWTDSSSVAFKCFFDYGQIKKKREILDYEIDYTFVDTTFTSNGYEINILDFPLLEGIMNKCLVLIQMGKKICVMDFQYAVKKDVFPKIVQTINSITFKKEDNTNNTIFVNNLPFKIDLSSIEALIKDKMVSDEGTMYVLDEEKDLIIMKCDENMYQEMTKSIGTFDTMNLPNGLSVIYKISTHEHIAIVKAKDKCMAIMATVNDNLFLNLIRTIQLKN